MFAHLHCHFIGSYSDSTMRFNEALRNVRAWGQPAIALTDHGELTNVYRFHDACRAEHVKPLFGAEVYFVNNAAECIRRHIPDRFHLVLIAKNRTGLTNLYRLLSDSWTEYSYEDKRGLVDWKLLEKYHEGIVLLSGCYYNIITQTIARRGEEAACAVVNRFRSLFGDDFHLEIGRHYIDEEDKVNQRIISLANACNMVPVVTNDAHYLDEQDWLLQSIVIKTRYDKVMGFTMSSKHYWLKSEPEMQALGFPDAWLNKTVDVAAGCDDIVLSPVPAIKGSRGRASAETLIAQGKAAYLSTMIYIDHETALRHVRDVMGKNYEDQEMLAQRIAGLPRRSEPDLSKIVFVPDRPLKDIIPLKRTQGKIVTQWDEEECRKAGAQILPAIAPTFMQRVRAFFSR